MYSSLSDGVSKSVLDKMVDDYIFMLKLLNAKLVHEYLARVEDHDVECTECSEEEDRFMRLAQDNLPVVKENPFIKICREVTAFECFEQHDTARYPSCHDFFNDKQTAKKEHVFDKDPAYKVFQAAFNATTIEESYAWRDMSEEEAKKFYETAPSHNFGLVGGRWVNWDFRGFPCVVYTFDKENKLDQVLARLSAK